MQSIVQLIRNGGNMTDAVETPAEYSGRYSRIAMLLHWLIAAAILFEISLGWRMDGPNTPQHFAVIQLHKSVGITILLLTLLRIFWRLGHRPPPLSDTLKSWERTLAHITHMALYFIMLAMPLSGWLMVSTSKYKIQTMLYKVIPWPNVPGTAALDMATRNMISNGANITHSLLALSLYALLALHIAGALKHHFIDKDQELSRMIPGRMKAMTGLLGLAMIILGGIFAYGSVLQPRVDAPVQAASVPAAAAPAAAIPAPIADPTKDAEGASDKAATPEETAVTTPAPQSGPIHWHVNRANSSLGFATSWSGSPVTGKFNSWNADINFNPDALDTSSVNVTISMNSATTGNADTQDALPGDDWFAAAAHPKATFVADKFKHISGNAYIANGTLNLRGVSRPLSLPFTLSINGKNAKMNGSAKLDRTAFGVGQGQWASTGEVSGGVTVHVSLNASQD